METSFFLILLVALTKNGIVRSQCSDKWTSLVEPHETHTMCTTPSPLLDRNGKSGVSQADIEIILLEHNKFRTSIADSIANMQKTFWDDELAKIAQKHVEHCTIMHDCDHCRLSANYPMIFVGQNVAAGSRNWTNAIQLWHSEHKNFEYNVGSANGGIIGHYTQVMGSEVALLGCGFATCKNIFRRMYTCNYMRGQSNLARPFVKSWHSCQMCKKNCDNKLCNCNGLICKNGGTINLNTCTCNCHHFSFGKQCEFTKCTKDDDEKYCGPFWKPEYCKKFGNIFYRCPFMCDKCKNLTSSEDL